MKENKKKRKKTKVNEIVFQDLEYANFYFKSFYMLKRLMNFDIYLFIFIFQE